MSLMNQEDQRIKTFPRSVQANVKQTIFILHNAVFNLEIGSSAEKKAKTLIFRYFENNPYSRVDPRTIVAVLLQYIVLHTGEYKSQVQITSALEVSKAWVQRKRREILADCDIDTYQHFSPS